MLYSLHGNWRVRLYIFFFGLMLLPLGISWCITSNRQMPKDTLEALFSKHEINTNKACFVTSYRFSHATAWVSKRSNIKVINLSELEYGNEAAKRNGEEQVKIEKDALLKEIKNPLRDRQIVIIVKENDFGKIFKNFPKPHNLTVLNGIECAVYNPEVASK